MELIRIYEVDPEEQETTISFSRRDKKVTIYTSDNTTLNKIKKLIDKNPKDWIYKCQYNQKGEPTGYFFETNKNNISIRSGARKQLSEEQKDEVRKRFTNYRKSTEREL